MDEKINEQQAQEALEKGYKKAEELLEDEDKLERFLQRLEKKLETVPLAGKYLAYVPIMASLLKSYTKKEYREVPIGSIIALISALIYFVSPVDLIPDFIPGVGLVDDALVIATCWNLVGADVDEYIAWRQEHGKELFPTLPVSEEQEK